MFLVRLPLTILAIPFRMMAGMGAVIAFAFRTLLLGLVAFAAVSSGPHGEETLDRRIEQIKVKIALLADPGVRAASEEWIGKAKSTLLESVAWADVYVHSNAVSDCAKK